MDTDRTWLRPASPHNSSLQKQFRDLIAADQAQQVLLVEIALTLLAAADVTAATDEQDLPEAGMEQTEMRAAVSWHSQHSRPCRDRVGPHRVGRLRT